MPDKQNLEFWTILSDFLNNTHIIFFDFQQIVITLKHLNRIY